jgi:hypothetical protein
VNPFFDSFSASLAKLIEVRRALLLGDPDLVGQGAGDL